MLQAKDSPLNPVLRVSVLEDPSGTLTQENIRSPELQRRFKPAEVIGNEINFGFSSATYWIKIPLAIAAEAPAHWIIEIPYSGLDHISFYAPGKPVITTGGLLPIQTRPIFYRYYAFPVELTVQEQDFYLQINSGQNISVPLRIWDQQSFNSHIQRDTLFQALYYGGIGVLAVFNFFIFIYLRDRSHLFYSLFAIFFGLGIFAGNGFGRLFLWTNAPGWDQISQTFLLAIGTTMALLFTAEFLNTRSQFQLVDRLLKLFALLLFLFATLLVIANIFNFSRDILFAIFPGLIIPVIAIILLAGVRACQAGQQSAKFFLLAWGVLCIGGLVGSLRLLDLVPSNGLTSYALQISSAFEMILLSFALASRIQHERLLREQAQSEALTSKETLVQSLRASEDRLEKQVLMRTNDLREMLESEKKLREQYIRFGSMISHEFRSPLGIIETQTALLARQSSDMAQKKRLSIISSATHRLALLFDRWLQGDRLENKIDRDRPELLDLNAWLADLIDKCRTYHSNHVLSFTPEPNAPILVADAKLLEVVILNLIDNACKYSPVHSEVKMSVILRAGKIGISIADSGVGIDPSNHEKIFDEFVQLHTGPKSKGYGLGLSFVKKVMAFYGGEIEVNSTLGQGAEFITWFSEKNITYVE